MPETEFLSPTELHTLTGAARSQAQAAWLKQQDLPHRLVEKRVIVSRAHVRAWLEGRTVVTSSGPNWSALSRA